MHFEALRTEVARLVYANRLEQALAELDRFCAGPVSDLDRARVARLRAEVLIQEGRPFSEAVTSLRTALDLTREDPSELAVAALDLLAAAQLAGDMRLADEAHGLFRAVAENHPENDDIRSLQGRFTYNLAFVEHLHGRHAEAAALFRQVAEIYERVEQHPRERIDQPTLAALAWVFYARKQIRVGNLVRARFGLDGARTLVDERHYFWSFLCCVQAELSLALHDLDRAAAWLERVSRPARSQDAAILWHIVSARLAERKGDSPDVISVHLAEARRLLTRYYRAYLDRELSALL